MNRLKDILNYICVTCMLIDSGGGLGIRNISFAIIFFAGLIAFYQRPRVNKIFFFFYLAFLFSILPGIIISFIHGVEITVIMGWIVAFLLIPLLYFYIKGNDVNNKSFVIAGTVFSILIIFLFFGRLLGVGLANSLNDYIVDHSDGFFGDKSFLSGAILPNVYFQGTLALVTCGIVTLHEKKYFSYFLILLAIILAPSRSGFIILVAWAGYLYVSKSYFRITLLPFITIIFYFILSNFAFGEELFSVFNGQSDGFEVRNGHVESVYENLSNNSLSLFFGEGPGTLFYTKGKGEYVDNIEISQLEYLRKYGIISFLLFSLFYFGPLLGRNKSNRYLKGALVLFYILSFSNPVLYSIFSMFFLSFAYFKMFSVDTDANLNTLNDE